MTSDPELISQQFETPGVLQLFELDTTPIAAGWGDPSPAIWHFTSQVDELQPDGIVRWGGTLYQPVEIETEGFEWGGDGQVARPTLRLSNATNFALDLIRQYGDLLGCIITRYRTYETYLDGHSAPDSSAWISRDVFEVEQKKVATPIMVEWTLRAKLESPQLYLPSRRVLRECLYRYREWRSGRYDYFDCPYNGSNRFDWNDQPTGNSAEDKCSKTARGCKLRFPGEPLPMLGFPGIGTR